MPISPAMLSITDGYAVTSYGVQVKPRHHDAQGPKVIQA